MGKEGGLFDLEKHFAFYGAYHNNPVNVLIHMVFVWPIFFTSLILFHFTRPIFILEFFQRFSLPVNFGLVVALIYGLFYIGLDKKAGTFAALLCLFCWYGSEALAARLGFSLAWKFVLAAQVLCWTSQFLGHGVFEKRAPALLDNLAQAFLMAPFFVLLEVLQNFGYEPYPGFRNKVHVKIESDCKLWKDKTQKKTH